MYVSSTPPEVSCTHLDFIDPDPVPGSRTRKGQDLYLGMLRRLREELFHGSSQDFPQLNDKGQTKGGKPYDIEYVMFVGFTPGTDKISSIVEFQDSLYLSRQFADWYEKSKECSA